MAGDLICALGAPQCPTPRWPQPLIWPLPISRPLFLSLSPTIGYPLLRLSQEDVHTCLQARPILPAVQVLTEATVRARGGDRSRVPSTPQFGAHRKLSGALGRADGTGQRAPAWSSPGSTGPSVESVELWSVLIQGQPSATPEGPKHVQMGHGGWDSGGRHRNLTNPTSGPRAWEAKELGDYCLQAGSTEYHLLKLCSRVFLSHLATVLGCSEWDGRAARLPTARGSQCAWTATRDRQGGGWSTHTQALMSKLVRHPRARAGCR